MTTFAKGKPTPDWAHEFRMALKDRDSHRIDFILKKMPPENLDITQKDGSRSFLALAVSSGWFEPVQKILDLGASPVRRSGANWSPPLNYLGDVDRLDLTSESVLFKDRVDGCAAIANLLISSGANPLEVDIKMESPLDVAFKNRHAAAMVALSTIEEVRPGGWIAIFRHLMNTPTLEVVLSNPRAREYFASHRPEMQNLLLQAVQWNDATACAILLSCGADPFEQVLHPDFVNIAGNSVSADEHCKSAPIKALFSAWRAKQQLQAISDQRLKP